TRTATPTFTSTLTPTTTPVCGTGSDYVITQSAAATVVAGTALVSGSQCNNCANSINLPFTYNLYGQPFTTVNAGNNGNLQFISTSSTGSNACLPTATFNNAIMPFWDDLDTRADPNCPGGGCGIYTSTTGSTPNRIFNIDWRAVLGTSGLDFEVRLYEGQDKFDIIYGTLSNNGTGATVGVQNGTGPQNTEYECNTGGLSSGLKLTFQLVACPTPTITPTFSNTP